MSQGYVRTYRMTQEEYEATLAQEDAARRQRNIDEARRRAAQRQPRSCHTFTPKVERTFEELARYVDDVLTRNDVRQAQAQATRYFRTVRLVQGGSPGLRSR